MFVGLIHTRFVLAEHSSFIVNNAIMKDIFTTLQIPPIDKEGSCCYERLFGLYFIIKKINTVSFTNYVNKISVGRR